MADAVFVIDPVGWEHAFHSWTGIIGRDIAQRTERGRALAVANAPAPGKLPWNRTGINYSTGRLASQITTSHTRWKNELEGRIIALPEYARYVQKGTRGSYIIRNRNPKKRLKFFWVKEGRWAYPWIVNHPGIAANPFMTRELRAVVP